jgi:hypothetical protein
VNWKTDLKLSDLECNTRLEITCRTCGHSHYQTIAALIAREAFSQAYLDELEKALKCGNRFCKGRVRIALVHQGKVEGFVGGMA